MGWAPVGAAPGRGAEELLSSPGCGKMALSGFGSLWCSWCGLAGEGSVLIAAEHSGIDNRLGNPGLVPAVQSLGCQSACPGCWPGPASAAERAKGLAFLKRQFGHLLLVAAACRIRIKRPGPRTAGPESGWGMMVSPHLTPNPSSLIFVSEDSSHCEHSGAEEVVDGPGHLHEDG